MGKTVAEKMEQLLSALSFAHNGECDLDKLLSTPYGHEMKRLAELRFRFEEDPGGEACLDYYRRLGISKELFTEGGFYARYAVFTPAEYAHDKLYPLIFWHHGGGNPIETDEFSIHITQMVRTEGVIVCMLQNTNWQKVDEMIPVLCERYPVDPERVYVMGYSQGGQAAHAALLRIPEKLAGVSACGCDAFPLWDNLDVRYTMEEIDHLRDTFVPVFQIAGECEFLNLLPHNHWKDIKLWNGSVSVNPYQNPAQDLAADPTNPPGKRADKPKPPAHTDPDWWKLQKLNLRLWSLGCEPVDLQRCLAFQQEHDDRLHHMLGFYGEHTELRVYGGVEHAICDKVGKNGKNHMTAYRYIGVANHPHWPLLMMGELSWEYLRDYRRDSATGRIVYEPVEGACASLATDDACFN